MIISGLSLPRIFKSGIFQIQMCASYLTGLSIDKDRKSMPKYAKKVDSNQKTLVEILRKKGFQVILMHTVGEGFPDLLVNRNKCSYLVEIKVGKKATFTDSQKKFYANWLGSKIYVLRSEEDALAFDPT